jgi:Ca2+-dependent lipid-binding protein
MSRLQVTVVSARNLANKDGLLGKNDPYVIVKCGHFNKHQTKTQSNAGANADFNETFDLELKDSKDIEIEVYDKDHLRDDLIGKAKVPIGSVLQQGSVESWYAIGEGAKNSGEVLLKIRVIQ